MGLGDAAQHLHAPLVALRVDARRRRRDISFEVVEELQRATSEMSLAVDAAKSYFAEEAKLSPEERAERRTKFMQQRAMAKRARDVKERASVLTAWKDKKPLKEITDKKNPPVVYSREERDAYWSGVLIGGRVVRGGLGFRGLLVTGCAGAVLHGRC